MGQDKVTLREINYLVRDTETGVVVYLTQGLWNSLETPRRKVIDGQSFCWSPRSRDHLLGDAWIKVVFVSEILCSDLIVESIARLRKGPVGMSGKMCGGSSGADKVIYLYL